jgi:hypothetical protein
MPAPARPEDVVPDATPAPAPEATVATARRIHLNEDWTATIVGLALVALGLLSLLPDWLVA